MAGNLSKKPNNDAASGRDGVGVTRAYVQDGNLYVVLSDNRTINAGHVAGTDGEDGHTPIKGVDYLTESDIAELKATIEAGHAHSSSPAPGVLLPDKAIGVFIPTFSWNIMDEDGDISKYGVETSDMIMPDPGITPYKYFRVSWGGKIYDVPNTSQQDNDVYLHFTDAETNLDVSVTISKYYTSTDECAVNVMLANATYRPNDIALEITAATGSLEEEVRQLDVKYIPDYVSKAYVDSTITHYAKPIYGEKTVFDLTGAVESGTNKWVSTHYPSPIALEVGKQYAVVWNGEIQTCKAEVSEEATPPVVFVQNEKFKKGEEGGFSFAMTTGINVLDIFFYGEADSCEVMPCTEEVKQLDTKYIPDYISKTEVEETKTELKAYIEETILGGAW